MKITYATMNAEDPELQAAYDAGVEEARDQLGQTHPFWVIRVAEIRTWIESGEYDRILSGEYDRTTDPDAEYTSDLRKAAQAYKEGAKSLLDDVGEAAKKMGASLMDTIRKRD